MVRIITVRIYTCKCGYETKKYFFLQKTKTNSKSEVSNHIWNAFWFALDTFLLPRCLLFKCPRFSFLTQQQSTFPLKKNMHFLLPSASAISEKEQHAYLDSREPWVTACCPRTHENLKSYILLFWKKEKVIILTISFTAD